jgi:hypothetical protein
MNFINEHGKLDFDLIAATDYSAFHGKFYEELDPHLAKLILDDNSTLKVPDMEYIEVNGDWITQQKTNSHGELMYIKNINGNDLELPRFTPESKTLLKKRITNLKNGNQLEIIYHQKKCNIGRFYSNDKQSLTELARNIRNTLYAYQGWIDYDFVASHPSILSQLALKLRIRTPCLDAWCNDKNPIVKMLSDHHSVEGEPPLLKDHIKKLICASLYGGGLDGWATGGESENFESGIMKGNPAKNEMPMKVKNYENNQQGHIWWNKLKEEIKKITDRLIGANPDLVDKIAPVSLGLPTWKRNNKTISYILGVFENDCLYHAYQYGVQNEIIKPRRLALAFDGFTTPPPPPHTDYSYHISGVNECIFEKTGFAIRMEVKPFDNWTIQQDLIDARREMVVAAAVESDTPVEGVVAEGDIAFAEGETDYSQEYLVWKHKHEQLHTKIIDTNNYFMRIFEIDEFGNEYFTGYKVFNRSDLVGAYEHLWFYKNVNNKKKKTKFIDEWIGDSGIQRKDRTDIIPPPVYCPPNVLNLWKQSEFEGRQIKESNERYNKDAVDAWINHIGIICDHDEDAKEYVLNWFAHLLQKPAQKPESCLVITGKQGTGKTIMLDPIKKVMGGGYFESTTPERDVWGNFNPMMASSMLVVLSEVDKRNAFGADGKIKALKTDKEITIRNLHQAPYTIRSYHRFIIATNHPDPVFLEEGQRRDMIIKCSDEKKNDEKYFNEFANLWEIEDNLISLYSYLLNRDISNWRYRIIPKTSYQKTLEILSRNPLDVFFEWWIARQVVKKVDTNDDGYISRFGNELFNDFRTWREENGGKYDLNGTGDLMKKIHTYLHLPKGSLERGTRTSRGQRTNFHLDTLRKHYNIGECLVPLDSYNSGNSSDYDSGGDVEIGINQTLIGNNKISELDAELENDDLENVIIEEQTEPNVDEVSVVCGDGTKKFFKKRKFPI